jgi:hypothetical protein
MGLAIGALVIGLLGCAAIAIPWGSANLATCRIVEADQLANDRLYEGDPPVAPVPQPGALIACEVLFPDSKPFTVNPGRVWWTSSSSAASEQRSTFVIDGASRSPCQPRKDGLAGRGTDRIRPTLAFQAGCRAFGSRLPQPSLPSTP